MSTSAQWLLWLVALGAASIAAAWLLGMAYVLTDWGPHHRVEFGYSCRQVLSQGLCEQSSVPTARSIAAVALDLFLVLAALLQPARRHILLQGPAQVP
jgi:hypothetical protein